MANTSPSLEAIEHAVVNTDNFGPPWKQRYDGQRSARPRGACVDRMTASRGGVIRTPGGVHGVNDAIRLSRGGSGHPRVNSYWHINGCAYASNRCGILRRVGAPDDRMQSVYLAVAAAAGIEEVVAEEQLKKIVQRVGGLVARIQEELESGSPDEVFSVEMLPGPKEVEELPRGDGHAVAYVMDTGRRLWVPNEGAIGQGDAYFDSSARLFRPMTASPERRCAALAISSATAMTVSGLSSPGGLPVMLVSDGPTPDDPRRVVLL